MFSSCIFNRFKKQAVVYDGTFANNQRNGEGISYYENGVIAFKGLWKDDKEYHGISLPEENIQQDVVNTGVFTISPILYTTLNMYANIITTLQIPDGACNETCFSKLMITDLPMIRDIQFGKECGRYVRYFVITRLPLLESLRIGRDSFTCCNHTDNAPDQNTNEERIMRENRGFLIIDCEQLQQCIIDVGCFSDYRYFTLESIP